MSKFLTLLGISIFAAANSLVAAGQKAAPPAPATKPTEQPAAAEAKPKQGEDVSTTIALKNKSSFQMDAGTRSPFWPISWKPTGKVAAGGTDQGEVPPGAFLVSSITLDGSTKFAIINGKTMSEGQVFGLQVGTQIYQVSVKRIEDGRVILARRDEEIVIPLRRK